jgi:hypothetical protein
MLYVPIPEKKDNEKQNDYMGRCMEFMKDEKYPQKQKVAICLNTYSSPKNKSKAGDRNSMEIDFSDKIKEIKEKKAQEEALKQSKIAPVIEEKIEAPVPVVEIKVEAPVVEPVHTAVTAPTEAVNEVKVEESKELAAEK